MANETILARKGKLTKRFNADAWALLKSKNGWEEVLGSDAPDFQIVRDQVRAIPPSGQKQEIVKKVEIVENSVDKKTPEINQVTENEQKKKFTTSAEFSEFAKQKLTKSILKDYFDSSEVNIPYKNNMPLDELISLLAERLENDIDRAKIIFGISTVVSPINASDL